MFLHVTGVEVLDDFHLYLEFNNGERGIVDFEPEMYGEVFEPLRNPDVFRKVYLTSRTIEWPNGADFAPEHLLALVKQQVRVTA